MKARYFVRPIWRMFDFKGVTGRTEYFTYTVSSCLVLALLWCAGLLVTNVNWYKILPPEMLNEYGMLPLDGQALNNVLLYGPLVSQLPMFALSARRLRDQYASWSTRLWLFTPFLGPVVLFGHGFAPTFRDYEVTQPDGTIVMRSQQLTDRRFRNALIGTAVVVAGAVAVADMAQGSETKPQPTGGKKSRSKKTPRNPKARLVNKDGSFNFRNNILATRKAHVRGAGLTQVKTGRGKRTM